MPTPLPIYSIVVSTTLGGVILCSIFPLVAADVPLRVPVLYQVVLFFAAFWLPCTIVIDMFGAWEAVWTVLTRSECGYLTDTPSCGGKDFLSVGYYSIATSAVALLCLGQQRVFAVAGMITWAVLVATTLGPQRTRFVRKCVHALDAGLIEQRHQLHPLLVDPHLLLVPPRVVPATAFRPP